MRGSNPYSQHMISFKKILKDALCKNDDFKDAFDDYYRSVRQSIRMQNAKPPQINITNTPQQRPQFTDNQNSISPISKHNNHRYRIINNNMNNHTKSKSTNKILLEQPNLLKKRSSLTSLQTITTNSAPSTPPKLNENENKYENKMNIIGYSDDSDEYNYAEADEEESSSSPNETHYNNTNTLPVPPPPQILSTTSST
eukprot:91757_1